MNGFARFLVLALLLLPRVCAAHPVGISRGEYRPTATGLEVTLAVSERELAPLVGVEPARLLERIVVTAQGERCAGRVSAREAVAPDGLRLVLVFACRAHAARLVDLGALLGALSRGHRHEARVIAGARAEDALLFEGQATLDAGEAALSNGDAADPASFHQMAAFLRMGVEHVLTGYDHLVFLLGLIVVGLGLRRTLLVVSAFTLAHSLTLALAALRIWCPPSALVEPAIALSIAYVGLENLFKRSHDRRAAVAFLFGLVHGFGFAGALTEVSFEGKGLVIALASFNAGVELGQLAALSVLFPVVRYVVLHPRFEKRAVPGVSAAVALSGLLWFASRVLAA